MPTANTHDGVVEIISRSRIDSYVDELVARLQAAGAVITAEMRQILIDTAEAALGVGVVEIDDVIAGNEYFARFVRAPGAMTTLYRRTDEQAGRITEAETALQQAFGEIALRARKSVVDTVLAQTLTLTTLRSAVNGASVAVLPVQPLPQPVGKDRLVALHDPANDQGGPTLVRLAESAAEGADEVVIVPQALSFPAGTRVLLPLTEQAADLVVRVNAILAQVSQTGGGILPVGRLTTALVDGQVAELPLDALAAPLSIGDVVVFDSAEGTPVNATVADDYESTEDPVAVAVQPVTVPGGAEAETVVSYSLATLIGRLSVTTNAVTLSAFRGYIADLLSATALATVASPLDGSPITSVPVEPLSAEAATAIRNGVPLVIYDPGEGTQVDVLVSGTAATGAVAIPIQQASPVAAAGSPVLLPDRASIAVLQVLADQIEATVTAINNAVTPVANLAQAYPAGNVSSLALVGLDVPVYQGNVLSVVDVAGDVETFVVDAVEVEETTGTVSVDVVDKATAGLADSATVSLSPRQVAANLTIKANGILLQVISETDGFVTTAQLNVAVGNINAEVEAGDVRSVFDLTAETAALIGGVSLVLSAGQRIELGSATIYAQNGGSFFLQGGVNAVDITSQNTVQIAPGQDLRLSSDNGSVLVQGTGGGFRVETVSQFTKRVDFNGPQVPRVNGVNVATVNNIPSTASINQRLNDLETAVAAINNKISQGINGQFSFQKGGGFPGSWDLYYEDGSVTEISG